MSDAGYSKTPLAKKLGYKPGMKAAMLGAPEQMREHLGALPEGVRLGTSMRGSDYDLIHLFVDQRAVLERRFDRLRDALVPSGMLWVSWPKRASKVPTDITEDVVREIALARGLVDVKVAAIDEVWSGLKLVRRLADR